MAEPVLSVVVPVLNEADSIERVLQPLQAHRDDGSVEVIVADGGSRDGTAVIARPYCDELVRAPRGRARQMNAGARKASAPCLLFLHADTVLPPAAPNLVLQALQESQWGRFDVRIQGRSKLLPVIAWAMNLRSRLTGIATGDQSIFVRRDSFARIGGFADIPLMEDVELSSRLLRFGKPACLRERVVASGRRWDTHGVLRTILLMWRLRLAYALGADPRRLARSYGYLPEER